MEVSRSLLWTLTLVSLSAVPCQASPPAQPRASFVDSFWAFLQDTFSFILRPIMGKGSKVYGRSSDRTSYSNHQLVRAMPRNEEQLEALESLEEEPGVLFWGRPAANLSLDMVVAPHVADDVKQYLADSNVDFNVLYVNVQKLINEQNPRFDKSEIAERKSAKGHSMTWNRYHRYSDITGYLEYLHNTYPHLVELFNIGKSSEGRSLKVAKISSNVSKEIPKPAIWIDGGIHGREWISPAVSLYFVKELVENYAKYRNIVDNVDWYIMPVINPDGYEYSHVKDRFWRKSRSPNKPDSGSERRGRLFWSFGDNCKGVDLNRNWDFHWGEKGASDDPCKETYSGARAFSEPETKAVSDFLMQQRDQMAAYLTLHSYSQMWLVPWGYTRARVKDYDDLVYMGRKAIEALNKVHGTEYEIGSSTSMLYPTSGSSDDWAKGKAGIKYSYTIELRDKGSYGFLLPAAQIAPTGRETFAAVRAVAKAILKEYG